MPEPEPSSLSLVGDALLDAVTRPTVLNHAARDRRCATCESAPRGVTGRRWQRAAASRRPCCAARRRLRCAPSWASSAASRSPAPGSPITGRCARRSAATVNDVVLAVVAGALRGWLLARAEPLRPATTCGRWCRSACRRAGRDRLEHRWADPLVSAPDARARPTAARRPAGRRTRPVGCGSPSCGYAMPTHRASDRAVGADRSMDLAGFAPPTLHALGCARRAGLAQPPVQLVITNVPGPQVPLYAAGARMSEMFPILPLGPGQAMTDRAHLVRRRGLLRREQRLGCRARCRALQRIARGVARRAARRSRGVAVRCSCGPIVAAAAPT